MDRIDQDHPLELRRKLGKRLGLAALLIVILLLALAAFDYLSQLEREDSSPPVAAVQPRLGPSISSGRPPEAAAPTEEPITPAPGLAPLPQAIEPPPQPAVAAQPSVAATPAAAPVAPAVPVAPAAPMAAVPTPKPGVVAVPPAPKIASVPSPAQSTPAPAPAAAVPEDSSSAPVLGAPAASRLPVPAEGSGAATPPRPVLSRLAAGFVLQAGVFTSTERAEELKARLLLAGVPVTIETRVQVGPFASQKEANAARKKIRELGIESILIPPRAGRR